MVTVVTKSGSNQFERQRLLFRPRQGVERDATRGRRRKPPFNQTGGRLVRRRDRPEPDAFLHAPSSTCRSTRRRIVSCRRATRSSRCSTASSTPTRERHGRRQRRSPADRQPRAFVRYASTTRFRRREKPLNEVDGLMLGGTPRRRYNARTASCSRRTGSCRPHGEHLPHPLPRSIWRRSRQLHAGVVKTSGSWGQARIAPQFFPRRHVTFNDTFYLNPARTT